ncbi:copper/zinc superoxide dismutase [Phakopsora pachyrhizi]|uniref:Copper/zinc superoxide dismutase n=1 Tax=Phakopsora pachyrhizi TaxID=170000 RepID=A0AAV0BDD5_PHAPC|nr:copper/zinc superoxide dismutase [Phakopsora pachyrhizi]
MARFSFLHFLFIVALVLPFVVLKENEVDKDPKCPHVKKNTVGRISAVANVVGEHISGTVEFDILEGGTVTVLVQVNVKGLPAGFEYPYHIHEFPINSTGNCDSAKGHFNPLGVKTECDFLKPATCEIGGGPSVNVRYYDPYLRFSPSRFSFVGRSVVIHTPDLKGRIACGTIHLVNNGVKKASQEVKGQIKKTKG